MLERVFIFNHFFNLIASLKNMVVKDMYYEHHYKKNK